MTKWKHEETGVMLVDTSDASALKPGMLTKYEGCTGVLDWAYIGVCGELVGFTSSHGFALLRVTSWGEVHPDHRIDSGFLYLHPEGLKLALSNEETPHV